VASAPAARPPAARPPQARPPQAPRAPRHHLCECSRRAYCVVVSTIKRKKYTIFKLFVTLKKQMKNSCSLFVLRLERPLAFLISN